MEKKNPLVAAALSFLITGLGQVYVKRPFRGIGYFLWALAPMFFEQEIGTTPSMFISLFITGLSIADAYLIAKYPKGKPEEKKEKIEKDRPHYRVY